MEDNEKRSSCAGKLKAGDTAAPVAPARIGSTGTVVADGACPPPRSSRIAANKHLGSIFNNDSNNIEVALADRPSTADFLGALGRILDARPGVFAQCVGFPEAVTYPTDVDNMFDKHLAEVTRLKWDDPAHAAMVRHTQNWFDYLRAQQTDVLSLTIQACRERGIPMVADYRMNAEDWYGYTYLLSDFGRAHPQWRIPVPKAEWQESVDAGDEPQDTLAGCLDPAVPEVFDHRLRIFTEVAERYDIDGIELDFRRWFRMVSQPLQNHPVLTRMVRDIRSMLDQAAQRKGRERMLLGVRVGPSLDDPRETLYAGGHAHTDFSCRLLGLDVETWIREELVDYVCPALFWPRWPGLPRTAEFAALARERNVGIYPTLFPLPAWLDSRNAIQPEETQRLEQYRTELCRLALELYADGADGISTFNWYFHLRLGEMANQWQAQYGYDAAAGIQQHIFSLLSDADALRRELERAPG